MSTVYNDKDDLMVQRNFVIPNYRSLVPVAEDNIFKLDFSHFMVLIDGSYEFICQRDAAFKSLISLSMYTYYCTILLWMRLYGILHSRGYDLTVCRELVDITRKYNLQVPRDIEMYLAGIGDVYDTESRKAFLMPCAELDRTILTMGAYGSYGRVDPITHIYYETMPAPIISLVRMTKDISISFATDTSTGRWNLPINLAPDITREPIKWHEHTVATLLPNVNLLGWKPSIQLEPLQINLLVECGFSVNSLGDIRNVGGLPLQLSLLERISNALQSSSVIPLTTLPTNLQGSRAQMLWLESSINDRMFIPFRETSTRVGKMISCAQNHIAIACAGATFRYRIKRSHTKFDMYSLCYMINDYYAPIGWRENCNLVYEWVPNGWNRKKYETDVACYKDAFDYFLARPSVIVMN